MAENSVFISYRREVGFPWARLVWEGLTQRSINVFLDIESMRSAGRFDDRLLNQIAARPYFATILTAGTLERCKDPDDWMRREIEHAITSNRIIVPIFVAPFDVASFPPDIPANIAEALATSNGVTVYSQYLEAAIDALAEDLLTPVAIPQAELSAEDQDFEKRAELDLLAQGPQPDGLREPVPTVPTDSVTPDSVTPDSVTPDSVTQQNDIRANDDDSAEISPAPPPPPNPVSTETQWVSSVAAGATSGPPPGSTTSTTVSADTTASGNRSGTWSRGVVLASVVAVAVGGLVLAAVFALGNDDSQPTTATSPSISTVAGLDTSPPDTASPPELGRRLDRLELGDHLGANDRIVSAGTTHELRMTDAGQLVMSGPQGDAPLARYEDRPGAVAIFQSSDGNFVVYRSIDDTTVDDVVHSFGTANLGGVQLRVDDSSGRGVLELVAADGAVKRVFEPLSVDEPSADTDVAPPSSTADTSEQPTTTDATEPAEMCRAFEPTADPPLVDFGGSDRDERLVELEPGGSRAFTLNVGFSDQEIEVTLSPQQEGPDVLICIIDAAGEPRAATTTLRATTGPLDIGRYRVVIVERGDTSATYNVQFVIPPVG